ncbi:Teichoic acid export ATP-binding protein TagH [hydrothermal vent metagenome]|uniref:Teichoic acid export ATP-binding protein TagH n=1 Tax=hydrothermal vent metagenome TaxID=652676 RepID=A0A3B1DFN7_9ZZZZ
MEYPIEFNNVWKKFKRGEKIYSLRDMIPRLTKDLLTPKKNSNLTDKEFWVTKGVSFKVKKGEVLGIIGPNGAGKSTILKLLSKVMRPTNGECMIRGRLSALIEITAGFHPDFTGRENVYFNGAILGMTKKEIDDQFEAIVNFSGVREFIDTPVKRYSSGMSARLGFAVAAHVNPDVMLVDEVLSVGDMTFQAKCTKKMRELLDSGVTIIFVSHNIPLVQNLCHRLILLDKGEVKAEGIPEKVIPVYESLVNQQREQEIKKEIATRSGKRLEVEDAPLIKIINVGLYGKDENLKENFMSDEPITIKINYEAREEIENPVFAFEIVRGDGIICCSSNSKNEYFDFKKITGQGAVTVKIDKTNLSPGIYCVNISILDQNMLHPYTINKESVLKIGTKEGSEYIKNVFIVGAEWGN